MRGLVVCQRRLWVNQWVYLPVGVEVPTGPLGLKSGSSSGRVAFGNAAGTGAPWGGQAALAPHGVSMPSADTEGKSVHDGMRTSGGASGGGTAAAKPKPPASGKLAPTCWLAPGAAAAA